MKMKDMPMEHWIYTFSIYSQARTQWEIPFVCTQFFSCSNFLFFKRKLVKLLFENEKKACARSIWISFLCGCSNFDWF